MTRGIFAVLLLGWALAAAAVAATGAEGLPALLIVAPFTLLGAGVGVALALPGERPAAESLVLVLALGLGTATVAAQTLLLFGAFHPALVVGVVAVIVGACLSVREGVRR